METFIAFFDVLGFKEFIFNNDFAETKRLFDHLLRDTQTSLSGDKLIDGHGVYMADLEQQRVNCLHVSDSIIFWTNSDNEEDFIDLVNVCYSFYWKSLQATFPVRGCLTFGEIDFQPDSLTNKMGITFFNYSLIGKGLVDAYLKAESIDYAGCLLDKLAIDKVPDKLINDLIYDHKICMYKVPFKSGASYEHVFKPIQGNHNDVSFRNTVNRIKNLFTYASKADINNLSNSVRTKLNNTIDFISNFRETEAESKRPE
ncbi:hypothetical protein SAMN05216327_104126 [Dyadobacter sp. SG02]|uniref:hypothetical protein n=1 Tax=Dyadobacter sp. SG02 TaxID=1855291 RepID=UPI0008B5DACA|nr:hypothetical protein [Dyadobacter sp. SG02]SEI82824.1 hypothetical protein SAMN05216327_104126 [Dyadobacter sp. SG02]